MQRMEEQTGNGETEDAAEDWRMCPAPDSPRKPVKSTAVVKYSSVQSLANFSLLQCNTDLNLPPSNWLSSSAESYGLQHVPSHSSGFSSFRMAHMFPDCVGEVDVVSDAENIKKLLKIPYSKGPVSMMVHRVENTLLIDEFDIHKHLLRTAETEWEWLKKFFYDHVLKSLSDKEKGLSHKNKSRYALQQKSLVSKFLYHSLAVGEPTSPESEVPANKDAHVPLPVATAWPPLPEPRPEEKLPDPASNHKFARNVVWTFEDIQMLIGTDMPIFGGTTHPCISLRLRDMSKPISVLTGIDYWLDNLMCNVPELVMCYHLDGIVQKYELIKTEDLPHLENSKFSPKVIRDVAQNILSFLKSNATKAGHTYWLFKGKDDDVVKLYDLTSLCTDVMDDKGQNPFTVPVAMLLYRVARNMKHSADGRRQQGTIRMLLKNCLALLAKEKYPQIVTSAHYMLSDLYVPADTDPASPALDGQLNDEQEEEEVDAASGVDDTPVEDCLGSSSVPVKALCASTPDDTTQSVSSDETKFNTRPPVCGGVDERCKMALQHVASGLQCLQYFDQDDSRQQEAASEKQMKGDKQSSQEQEVPKMARPFQAIPMPYSPLSSQKDTNKPPEASSNKKKKDRVVQADTSPKALLCKSKSETMPTWQQPDNMSWSVHLKTLLYEKASLVYVTLAESEYVAENYGTSLHYIMLVLQVMQSLATSSSSSGLRSYLLGRAGDCCFMMVQDWTQVDAHRQDFAHSNSVDHDIMNEVKKEADAVQCEPIPESIDCMEQMLCASCSCYQRALALEPHEQQKKNLQRRLGNIHNELGVLYMNQAAARYQEEMNQGHQQELIMFQTLFTKSLHHLESGVKAFETVHDDANLALLHSNTGRLMRMCAHFHSPDANNRHSELTGKERHFYVKALNSYQKAVQVLSSRRSNPGIWDTVVWELSTTLFTMATLLQDFPSLGTKSQEEAEREVVDYLMKALKYCDVDTAGPRQPVYQFRAATIHHRLASLYHKSYRTMTTDDARRKNVLLLSRLHYDKSSRLLLQLEHPSEFLRVQMERVALSEFQAQNAPSYSGKLKSLQMALDLLQQCRPILKVMQERTRAVQVHATSRKTSRTEEVCLEDETDDVGAPTAEELAEHEEEKSLLDLLEQRLQFVLRSLAKLCLNKKESGSLAQVYKTLYSLTLKDTNKDVVCRLLEVLGSVNTALPETDR